MNRMTKELINRGIITDPNYEGWSLDEVEEELYEITDKFIITLWWHNSLEPQIHIYDRFTLEPIGGQDLHKTISLCSNRPKDGFHSFTYEAVEADGEEIGYLVSYWGSVADMVDDEE